MSRPNRRFATTAKYPRTARINEVLREIIASELEKEQDEDRRLTLVTITGIETEGDLRHATVFFSALGTTASLDEVHEALEERRVPLQKAIGNNVRMKRTPLLRFLPDPGIIQGLKVERLLGTVEIPDDVEEEELPLGEIETNPELDESRNDN